MNDSSPITQPFSKAQLELLQLFFFDIPEEQYDVLKKILLRFKAEVLMDKADRIWDEKAGPMRISAECCRLKCERPIAALPENENRPRCQPPARLHLSSF